jgi:hypothetical protein
MERGTPFCSGVLAMKYLPVWIVLGLLLCAGCSGEAKEKSPDHRKKSAEPPGEREDAAPGGFGGGGGGAAAKDKAPQDADRKPAQGEAPTRKIIYTANLSLIVEDLSKAEEALLELVDKHKCLVGRSAITGSAGSPRQGTWTLRVPVEGLEGFRRAVLKLGVPETNTTDSEDVTDRYYDLESSVKNYRAEEEALRKLVEKSAGKMEDVIAVRRELAQLREKIDHLEGQRRRLANLSALTTVHVTFHEIKDYVPPQAPTFGSRISSTFADSVDALSGFSRGLVLVGAALAPWLPVVLVVGVLAWVTVRRRLNRARPLPVLPLQQE